MIRLWPIAAALALLPSVAGAADVQGDREKLVSRPLPDYFVAHSEANAVKSTIVELPKGETPENWTRKVTTQWFKRLAKDMELDEYATEIRRMLEHTCPDALMSPVRTDDRGDFESFSFRGICPETASGNRISFILTAIAGKKDMFVKQVAFRGKATSRDFLWGFDYLRTVRLCKIKSKKRGCR